MNSWCQKLDFWATDILKHRNRIATRNFGPKYVQQAKWVVNKWRFFVKKQKAVKLKMVSKQNETELVKNSKKSQKFELPERSSFQIKFRSPKVPAFLSKEIPKPTTCSPRPSIKEQPLPPRSPISPSRDSCPSSSGRIDDPDGNESINETEPELIQIFGYGSNNQSEVRDQKPERKDDFPLYFIDESKYRPKHPQRPLVENSADHCHVTHQRPKNPIRPNLFAGDPGALNIPPLDHGPLFHQNQESLQTIWNDSNDSFPDPIFNLMPTHLMPFAYANQIAPPPNTAQMSAHVPLHYRQSSYQSAFEKAQKSPNVHNSVINRHQMAQERPQNQGQYRKDSSSSYFGVEINGEICGLDGAWALSSTTPSGGSIFTDFDAFEVIDENEIHEMLEELDDLKIVISRLKPSGNC